ncbi:hypothetical protein FV139_14735 [Parahaliea maris]|uniref:Uncharacterized protein n=1 Tax=Parahaliea maris TaxID=2716870 RepID=A0A5C8ZVU3_9GAMM|nr:hypothetical protein [Parahaliea maris]TXS91979.1 hypothetical protein FV139_14735 [Parahaliea maris]
MTRAPHGSPINSENFFFLAGGDYRATSVDLGMDLVTRRLGDFDPDWKASSIPNLNIDGLEISELEAREGQ